MQFRLVDGQEVVGNSYTDIVQAMNDQKMTPAKRLSTYRKAMALRAGAAYNVEIDYTSDKSLILGLESVGLVERL